MRIVPALGLLWLTACGGRAPALEAHVELASVLHAWGQPVAGFLAPTALGAGDETLCSWARGESTAANVARWKAEGRLRWRVVVADGPEARLLDGVGLLGVDLGALADAEATLAARCGTNRPRVILVVADHAASYGAVADAVELAREQGGYLDAWLAVSGPVTEPRAIPGFAEGAPLVALVGPEGRVSFSNREGRGYEGPRDALVEPLRSAAAPARAGCVTVSARPETPWVSALATMDSLRTVGVDLHAIDMEGAPGAGVAARQAVPPRAPVRWELTDTVSVVPVRTLSRCGGAPMGWWCDNACIPDTGAWPEVTGEKAATTLGEAVYTAHRVRLFERRQGSADARAQVLYDDGLLSDVPASNLPGWPAACDVEGKKLPARRWLVFETFSESGVMRPDGFDQGRFTSLDPSFEATVAAVLEAVVWRKAIADDSPPWDPVRAALDSGGPRASLAWDALANPAWHQGSVDPALVGVDGSIRAAPASTSSHARCGGQGG